MCLTAPKASIAIHNQNLSSRAKQDLISIMTKFFMKPRYKVKIHFPSILSSRFFFQNLYPFAESHTQVILEVVLGFKFIISMFRQHSSSQDVMGPQLRFRLFEVGYRRMFMLNLYKTSLILQNFDSDCKIYRFFFFIKFQKLMIVFRYFQPTFETSKLPGLTS